MRLLVVFSHEGLWTGPKVRQKEGEVLHSRLEQSLQRGAVTATDWPCVCLQEYGQVPAYLEQRKKEMEEAQAEYDRYVEESMQRGQMELVTSEERCVCV